MWNSRVSFFCYTPKNYHLFTTLLRPVFNNLAAHIVYIVVNNIVQHCWAWISPQSGVTMLNNIVNNYEQYGQHNIVASCFQQPWTSDNFLRCYRPGLYLFLTVHLGHARNSTSCKRLIYALIPREFFRISLREGSRGRQLDCAASLGS